MMDAKGDATLDSFAEESARADLDADALESGIEVGIDPPSAELRVTIHSLGAAKTSCQLVLPRDPGHWYEACYYQPSPGLKEAMRFAVLLRRPLILWGRSGSGKTVAAYWAALVLAAARSARSGSKIEETIELIHASITSTTSAESMKYEFRAVDYFRESQLLASRPGASPSGTGADVQRLDRAPFFLHGKLWRAFEKGPDALLLLDEIDKAPRDLPNDLLDDIDQGRFAVWGLSGEAREEAIVRRGPGPLIIMTSNDERELPAPFLRRCLHYKIESSKDQLRDIVARRLTADPRFGGRLRARGISLDQPTAERIGSAVVDVLARIAEKEQGATNQPEVDMWRDGWRLPPTAAQVVDWVRALLLEPGNPASAAILHEPSAFWVAIKKDASLLNRFFLRVLFRDDLDLERAKGRIQREAGITSPL
jgi:MoxR-like ATPase